MESFIEHQDTCSHAGATSAKSGAAPATSGPPPPPSTAQNALRTIMNNKGNTSNNQSNSSSKSNDYRSIYIAATNNSSSNNNSASPVTYGVGMASFEPELQQLLSPTSTTYAAPITITTARNSNSNAINTPRTQVSHNHNNNNLLLLDLDLNHNHLDHHHHNINNTSHINIPSHHAYQPHMNVKSSSPTHYYNVHVNNDHGATTLGSHSNAAIHGPKTEHNNGSMIGANSISKSDVSHHHHHRCLTLSSYSSFALGLTLAILVYS